MKTVLVSISILLTGIIYGQTNTYLSDLVALKSFLQQTPSFKAQIKGNKLSDYHNLYNRLAADTQNNPNSYQYFYNLSQLLFPIRDNHLGFSQIPDYSHFKSKESIDSFVNNKAFLEFPSYDIHIDSLKNQLAGKSPDSIEGIYHYDKFYSVGVFKTGDREYVGVVVDSDINLWAKGQVAIHLYEYAPHLYKAIYSHPMTKAFILQPVEKYQNQTLVNSYFYASYSQKIYSKQLHETDHVHLTRGPLKFALKNIGDDIQYLLIQSFQADNKTSQASQRFYDSIKNSLTATHLILDLRDNEGGAEKEMRRYYSLLKAYARKGNLYVLLNNGTLSQAEIFTLKLQELNRVVTLGQTTKGMLSYGSNFGNTEKLPSGRFKIYLTDMKGSSTLLQYEDFGISPGIVLKGDKDWVEQVVDFIRKK